MNAFTLCTTIKILHLQISIRIWDNDAMSSDKSRRRVSLIWSNKKSGVKSKRIPSSSYFSVLNGFLLYYLHFLVILAWVFMDLIKFDIISFR